MPSKVRLSISYLESVQRHDYNTNKCDNVNTVDYTAYYLINKKKYF
jgi:hypothetical protein